MFKNNKILSISISLLLLISIILLTSFINKKTYLDSIVSDKLKSKLEIKYPHFRNNYTQVAFLYTLSNETGTDIFIHPETGCFEDYILKNSKDEIVSAPTDCAINDREDTFFSKQTIGRIAYFDNLPEDKYTFETWFNLSGKQKYNKILHFEITAEEAEITLEGIYVGRINNNSVKIKIDSKDYIFQLTDSLKSEDIKGNGFQKGVLPNGVLPKRSNGIIENFYENDKVYFKFTKNKESQLILQQISSENHLNFIGAKLGIGEFMGIINQNLKLNLDLYPVNVKIKSNKGEEFYQVDEILLKQLRNMPINEKIIIKYDQMVSGKRIATMITKYKSLLP